MTTRPARRVLVGLAVAGGSVVVVACVTLGAAGLSHAVLVALVGQEGIVAIDDTLPMVLLVGGCYALGTLAGLVAFALGYRRLLRGRRTR